MYLPLNEKCSNIFYHLIKLALYTFTVLLLILGISLITFSAWYIYEGREYHLDTSVSFSVSSIAFIIGIVLTTISACGFIGVIRENVFLSKVFLSGMMLLMIVELASVILIFAFKRKIMSNANMIFEGFINNYADDDDIRIVVDTIQSNLHCCGITSAQDWENNMYYSCSSISTLKCSVPASCCKKYALSDPTNDFFCGVGVRKNNTLIGALKSVYITGCKYEIYSYLERKQNYTIGLFIISMVPQFFGLMLMSVFMMILSKIFKIKYNYEIHTIARQTDENNINNNGKIIIPNANAIYLQPNNSNKETRVYLTNLNDIFKV